jgi:hypothetical protein
VAHTLVAEEISKAHLLGLLLFGSCNIELAMTFNSGAARRAGQQQSRLRCAAAAFAACVPMIAGCSQRAVVTCALAEGMSRAVPALGGL